ncbi:hypothetical protein FRC12_021757, partial [Ceratobasidium sp. 428]
VADILLTLALSAYDYRSYSDLSIRGSRCHAGSILVDRPADGRDKFIGAPPKDQLRFFLNEAQFFLIKVRPFQARAEQLNGHSKRPTVEFARSSRFSPSSL